MTAENYYELSDDELMAMDLTNEVESSTDDTKTINTDETTSVEVENELVDETSDEPIDNVQADDIVNDESENNELDEHKPEQPTDDLNYENFYQKLTKPFRANGREISLDNPDDMIALMQKGANYSKKMEQIKPKINLVKTLEKYGLNDTQELAYLLDLRDKKPEAIAKFVKEADIDLYSFDTEIANDYTPTNIQVNESTGIDEVINELTNQTPAFKNVLDDIVQNWDKESHTILSEKPEILRAIHNEVNSGMFDKVMALVEKDRMLGRNTDINYLEHYSMIESQLLNNESNTFKGTRPSQNNKVVQNEKRNKAKASNGTNNLNNNNNLNFNPLTVSDEELLKLLG